MYLTCFKRLISQREGVVTSQRLFLVEVLLVGYGMVSLDRVLMGSMSRAFAGRHALAVDVDPKRNLPTFPIFDSAGAA
eukprot:scaffold212_cov173-Amphora_coffeaeformis.AAC.12